MASECPFCSPEPDRVLRTSPHALALTDLFPLTEGHVLVVPREHAESLFELPDEAQADLWKLVREMRSVLASELDLDAFTIGINDGEAAGQTVSHANVHVIPRRRGDVPDPTGGIRKVIPGRARYWDPR